MLSLAQFFPLCAAIGRLRSWPKVAVRCSCYKFEAIVSVSHYESAVRRCRKAVSKFLHTDKISPAFQMSNLIPPAGYCLSAPSHPAPKSVCHDDYDKIPVSGKYHHYFASRKWQPNTNRWKGSWVKEGVGGGERCLIDYPPPHLPPSILGAVSRMLSFVYFYPGVTLNTWTPHSSLLCENRPALGVATSKKKNSGISYFLVNQKHIG